MQKEKIEGALKRICTEGTRQRGKSYYAGGRVTIAELENIPGEKISIQSEVRGTHRRPYVCEIVISETSSGATGVVNKCSCPVGWCCKHVAATLFKAIDQIETVEVKQSTIPPVATQSVAQGWLKKLEKSTQLPRSPIQRPPQATKFLLILSMTSRCITIKPCFFYLKKNGDFMQKKPEILGTNMGSKIWQELTADEWDIMRLLVKFCVDRGDFALVSHNLHALEVLQKLIATNLCHEGTTSRFSETPITWGEEKEVSFVWDVLETGDCKLVYQQKGDSQILEFEDLLYYDAASGILGPAKSKVPLELMKSLVTSDPVPIEAVDQVSEYFKENFTEYDLPLPPKVVHETVSPPLHIKVVLGSQRVSTGHFYRSPREEDIITAHVILSYDGHCVKRDWQDSWKKITGSHVLVVKRNPKMEREIMALIQEDRWFELTKAKDLNAFNSFYRSATGLEEEGMFVFHEYVDRWRTRGWEVILDSSFPFHPFGDIEDWYTVMDSGSGIDWFDFEIGVQVEGKRLNLIPALINHLKAHKEFDEEVNPDEITYVSLGNKRYVPIKTAYLQQISKNLIELYTTDTLTDEDRIRLSRFQVVDAAELANAVKATEQRWMGDGRLKELATRFQNFSHIEPVQPPASLNCQLRHYQAEGLSWMHFLKEYAFSGILADDMGLGKTVQTIAHLLKEKEAGQLTKAALIVAPTSVVSNWQAEIKRFAPSLKALVLQGMNRKEHFETMGEYDIILTTYPLLVRDKSVLLSKTFDYLILDEAQVIKNPRTKAYLMVQQLKARSRLCLTGTPMENHLGELWSIFNFLMPGLLGDQKTFAQLFRNPIERAGNRQRQELLAKRLRPFMLRRNKEQVATELPAKTEIIQKIDLSQEQQVLYESIRIAMNERVQDEIKNKGFSRSHIVILDALLKMRQVCCDPRLLKLDSAKKVETSAKMDFLRDHLPEMVERGSRILIFSQFATMLDLIEKLLLELEISFSRLTGQTRDRATPVAEFQAGISKVFLISLKAGGTGLNLTAADTVIHVDPWWNPAAENQATDRAYRIGQDKPVFVYKLVTSGTIEEKILQMQQRKAALSAGIFDEKASEVTTLTADDLKDLFAPLSTLDPLDEPQDLEMLAS